MLKLKLPSKSLVLPFNRCLGHCGTISELVAFAGTSNAAQSNGKTSRQNGAGKGQVIFWKKSRHNKIAYVSLLLGRPVVKRNKTTGRLLAAIVTVTTIGLGVITHQTTGHASKQGEVLGAATSQNETLIKTAAANLEDDDQKENKPFEYEVQGGDTLSNIAEKFGLRLNTILWANSLSAKSIIRPGQILILLPVDGILHRVEKGETISEIAALHKADTQKVVEYNRIGDVTKIHAGDMIIVPNGQPLPTAPQPLPKPSPQPPVDSVSPPAPASSGSLLWPTAARNISQGYSSRHRGLDTANGGTPPIFASHSGTVEFSGLDGAWGNTIVIRGDDGLVTRYSHNSENYVVSGQTVTAGETIGKVGNSGNVRGRTGLHLDFRVYKRGIAINPLNLLR